jgi:hypothetical protein
MSQRVETSARELVSTRSSQPENGHLRKNAFSLRQAVCITLEKLVISHDYDVIITSLTCTIFASENRLNYWCLASHLTMLQLKLSSRLYFGLGWKKRSAASYPQTFIA